ncbi:hypothetical protein J7L67_05105 [bacterium]|nr:hypothetical protein [bacterium]
MFTLDFSVININDIYMIGLSVLFHCVCLVVSEFLRRRFGYGGNFTRKFIHVTVSLWGCWVFYAFADKRMAIVLPVVFILMNLNPIRKRILHIAHIDNDYHPGMLYYPVSLFLLVWFCWVGEYRFIAVISLLNLGLGDSAAAVMGSRFAKKIYKVGEHTKSYLGSFFMLAVCFVTTVLTLVYYLPEFSSADVGIAFLIALGVTFMEALSVNGMDNLSVPMVSAVILSFFYIK